MCNKPADVSEVSKNSGMGYHKCEDFLERMSKLGFIRMDADSAKIKRLRINQSNPERFQKFPLPFLSAPTSVDIFLTSRCNLDCVHCFSSTEDRTIHEMPTNQLRSIFEQLEILGVFEVRINGGEPFLHPGIREILMDLKERSFRKVILTNGTLLDEEMANLLKTAEVVPTVSLDDSEANTHDLFRGSKGSFNRTVGALKLLQRLKIQYGINCCLHKRNLSRSNEIIDFAIKYGACRISFLDLKITGRIRNHLQWIPSYDEYQRAILDLMLSRIRYRRKIDVTLDTFLRCPPLRESVQEARRGYVSCQAGKNRLSIDSTGSVYPCNLVLSDPRWTMGDTRKDRISDIWFSDKWLFFRGLRISSLNKCGDCTKLYRCSDFYCRLLPYIATGNPFDPHPKCK